MAYFRPWTLCQEPDACGIPVFKRLLNQQTEAQQSIDIAKRVLQWRWLIIDEISMVSSTLLAQVDLKLREVVREVGAQKHIATVCLDLLVA